MFLPRQLLGTSPGPTPLWLILMVAIFTISAAPRGDTQETGGDAADYSGTAPRGNDAERVAVAYSEEQVKAAFLFHFATYAEWPEGHTSGSVSFAVLRDRDIASELRQFAKDRTIQGRAAKVREIRSLSELDGDEVLFIGASQNRRLAQLIRDVDTPTLVVTDAPDGLPDGAMINFQLVDHRVRFEIALPAVQRVGLTLSSRLLSAAMRVEMSRCHLECHVRGGASSRFAAHQARLRTPNPA